MNKVRIMYVWSYPGVLLDTFWANVHTYVLNLSIHSYIWTNTCISISSELDIPHPQINQRSMRAALQGAQQVFMWKLAGGQVICTCRGYIAHKLCSRSIAAAHYNGTTAHTPTQPLRFNKSLNTFILMSERSMQTIIKICREPEKNTQKLVLRQCELNLHLIKIWAVKEVGYFPGHLIYM